MKDAAGPDPARTPLPVAGEASASPPRGSPDTVYAALGDPDRPAVVIRRHMWESQYKLMSFCLSPMAMYEEPAKLDGSDAALWERHSVEV